MTTRLAGGVLPAAREGVWPLGDVAGPGRPVAVGPVDASEEQVNAALDRLKWLVARAGVVAADAGVELGGGFRSARIEGGAGNRRDGMLAALGVVGAEALGSPAAISVALFGIEATKPLGAAATAAVVAGRWSALRLAVAAAELLGPEQLVELLQLDGADPFPDGLPSVVGAHLRQVLEPLPRARRAVLLGDLWARVEEHREMLRRRERRRGTQAKVDRLRDLERRFDRYDDDEIVLAVRRTIGQEPTLAQAARWQRPSWYRRQVADGALEDCLAATLLLRLAVSVADHGVAAALELHRDEIVTEAARMNGEQAGRAAKHVPGFTGLPARPGVILREIERHLPARPEAIPRENEQHLAAQPEANQRENEQHLAAQPEANQRENEQHLAGHARDDAGHAQDRAGHARDDAGRARDEAGRARDDAGRAQDDAGHARDQAGRARDEAGRARDDAGRAQDDAGRARDEAGRARDEAFVRTAVASAGVYGRLAYGNASGLLVEMIEVPDAPGREDAIAWAAQPMQRWRPASERARWEQPPLFELEPGPERVGNMVWLADLGDALAQLYWCAPAIVEYGRIPDVNWNLPADEDSPLAPRWDSIALVAAGTAQLAGLAGARPSLAKAKTWPELIAALQAGAAVTEALTGAFPVPEAVLATDGTTLPGGDEVIEIARTPRQTAEWGTFMGNCIGGSWYTGNALSGKAFLVALRAPGGRIVANADIRPSARGWRIYELRGRFNQDPEPELTARVKAWLAALAPPPALPNSTIHEPRAERAPRRPRTPAARISREHGPALGELAAAAVLQPGTVAAIDLLGRLLGTPEMTALRRVPPGALTRALATALDADRLTAGEAWRAGGTRPMSAALTAYAHPNSARDARPMSAALTAYAHPNSARDARPMSAALAGYGHPDLAPLALDEPLPGSLRTVARAPGIAEARTTELVARRIRRSLGALLRADSPVLTARRPDGLDEPMLCACTLAVTTWAGPGVPVAEPRRVTVPGFPVTRLNEDPWESAWPDATELGADREAFWDHVAAHGLLAPAGWLGPSGWPGLWNQAHRT
ncbi:hypothetical protein [Dactylosporangium sp. CS-033363]|uniref:hypothetical protein n=1 Tax=Dactylosporangium sp. CS-033363 TaxID=3239935 RepID=UPI003D92E9F5